MTLAWSCILAVMPILLSTKPNRAAHTKKIKYFVVGPEVTKEASTRLANRGDITLVKTALIGRSKESRVRRLYAQLACQ